LKTDKEVGLAAVKSQDTSFQHAADILKNDKDILTPRDGFQPETEPRRRPKSKKINPRSNESAEPERVFATEPKCDRANLTQRERSQGPCPRRERSSRAGQHLTVDEGGSQFSNLLNYTVRRERDSAIDGKWLNLRRPLNFHTPLLICITVLLASPT